MYHRLDVYGAIDSERNYQDSLCREGIPVLQQLSPMEQVAVLEVIINQMKEDWYHKSGQPSMDYWRKIAATAVRVMEQHGAPYR